MSDEEQSELAALLTDLAAKAKQIRGQGAAHGDLAQFVLAAISTADIVYADDTLWAGVQELLDALPFYVMLVDDQHTIMLANKQIQKDLGLTPVEVVGKFCPKVVHGIDGPYPLCPLEDALETGESCERDFFDEKYGTWGRSSVFPTNIRTTDGRRLYFHMFRDVTELKQTEEALFRERELITRIMQTSLAGILVFDAQGTITFVNPQVEAVLGLEKERIIGHSFNDLPISLSDIRGDAFCSDDQPFQIVKQTGQPAFDVRFFAVSKNGKRLLSVNAAPLFRENGDMDGVVANLEDITRKIKVANSLKDALTTARDEKAKSEAIIAAISDGISIQDIDFRIIYENQAHIDMLGDHVGEFCYLAYRNSSAVCLECPLAQTFIDGQVHKAERELKGGEDTRVIEITTSPLRDAEDRIIAGIELVRDVTKNKRQEHDLQQERDRAQKYLDLAGVMIVALDATGRISLINRRGCEIIGLTETELIGANWFDNFIPADDREFVRGIFAQLMAGQFEMAETATNPIINHENEQRIIYWHNCALRDAEGRIIGTLSSGEDVTERTRIEAALRESETRYRQLVELAPDAIAIHMDGRFVFANSAAANLIGADSSQDLLGKSIMSIVHPDFAPIVRARVKTMNEDQEQVPLIEEKFIRFDGSIIDVDVIATPFVYEGQKATLVIARDISERKRAEQETQDNMEMLRRSLESTIKSMALIIETRDVYTAGHQQRVSKIAGMIAREMGLDEQRLEVIRIAGLLHDIGKISTPAEILSRPGPITESEHNLIKVHCQLGCDILKQIEFPVTDVAEIILQHHERIDGNGYPHGLSGDAILLEAKILAVADAFEAMTSRRPYREAFSVEQALNELVELRGHAYDERVVDACAKVLAVQDLNSELLISV